jgi:hypothetical protein
LPQPEMASMATIATLAMLNANFLVMVSLHM